MIDFRDIRGESAGQRDAFEELVCQLAHRIPPNGAAQYHRLNGAGGDGGVEAYWQFHDGRKHAYQAKFYLKSADIDWTAIDNSVSAALTAHPTLTRYNIAIACDPTGAVPGRKGTSGWQHWETHRAKWTAQAEALGMAVEFTPWNASVIDSLLNFPEARGLREFWLGTLDLSTEWFANHFERTVAALEERYHPEDHVDVSARTIFDGLRRSKEWRTSLREPYQAVVDGFSISLHANELPQGVEASVNALMADLPDFRALSADIELPAHAPFPLESWKARCIQLDKLAYGAFSSVFHAVETAREAQVAAAKQRAKKKPKIGTKGEPSASHATVGETLQRALQDLGELRQAIRDLQLRLDEQRINADASRFVLIEGRAGSGKSHLLAAEVARGLDAGAPALFMLGTQLGGAASIEQQLLAYFDLAGDSFETLLGALSAAAESSRQRGLIVIDAINEGGGIALWRSRLASFAATILRYPGLALCLSCRSEYRPALAAGGGATTATNLVIQGFETEAEREAAAIVYMDRRGILRPATPWLSPEFTNPLFLRTACLALQSAGLREFPKGLRGTKELLSFYLKATADSLGTIHDGTGFLVRPVIDAMLALTSAMAADRRDYLPFVRASMIVDKAFAGIGAPPDAGSWIYTLKHNGLLRYDPDPATALDDPLAAPQDVVRLSFQRFQDHLTAEAILANIADPADVFAAESFAFIFDDYDIDWPWHGVVEALASQIPERFGLELVDLLPGGAARWEDDWLMQRSFVESVRWRAVTAFTDRSLELLNGLRGHDHGMMGLIVELSLIQSHPWNGDFLHENLLKRKLAKRDRFWTAEINLAYGDASHPVNLLIDWAGGTGPVRADDETLRLALQTLGWIFTSTARAVRDGATKAMTALLLGRCHLFPQLAETFAGIDDLYVAERIYAAAYGACCIEPSPGRLRAYSEAAYKHIFSKTAPAHLLLRDYASGIVEIAATRGSLGAGVILAKTQPPYGSPLPVLRGNKDQVIARSEKLGARDIVYSCFRGTADFGRYVIETRVDDFSDARLSDGPPLRVEDLYDLAKTEIVAGRRYIELAFRLVETVYKRGNLTLNPETMEFKAPGPDPLKVKAAEATLKGLLTAAEYRLYKSECLPKLKSENPWRTWRVRGGRPARQIDTMKARYWVADRAMSLGWTDKLFPHDASSGKDRHRGSKVERIGKKYQWIALYELMARLADNFWLAPGHDNGGRRYERVTDVSFVRDIDPTVLPPGFVKPALPPALPALPQLVVPNLPEAKLASWVEDPALPDAKVRLALCDDASSDGWVALYRYATDDVDAEKKRSLLETPWKQTEFHYVALHIFRPDEQRLLIRAAAEKEMDFHEWLPSDSTDGPFLAELGLRATWPNEMWDLKWPRMEDGHEFSVATPVASYQWESHLDGSLPEGHGAHVPQPWLINALGLRAAEPGRLYVDCKDRPVIVCHNGYHEDYCLIRKGPLLAYLDAEGLRGVWTVIGERMGWWDDDTVRGKRVRHNGILWLEGKSQRIRSKSWASFD